MKVKKYKKITVGCIGCALAAFMVGLIFSLCNGQKYAALVALLGCVIQGLCALCVLFYAIYHDEWKEERNKWPRISICPNCYYGENVMKSNCIDLTNGENDIGIFECKILPMNSTEISMIDFGEGAVDIESKKILLRLNVDGKTHEFSIRLRDISGNWYQQTFEYKIENTGLNNNVIFKEKSIKSR